MQVWFWLWSNLHSQASLMISFPHFNCLRLAPYFSVHFNSIYVTLSSAAVFLSYSSRSGQDNPHYQSLGSVRLLSQHTYLDTAASETHFERPTTLLIGFGLKHLNVVDGHPESNVGILGHVFAEKRLLTKHGGCSQQLTRCKRPTSICGGRD